MNNNHSEHNILQTVAVLIALILLFGLVGSGDYADELAIENARLRGMVSACHATEEVRP